MKPPQSRCVVSTFLLAAVAFGGCRNDSQMVYTAPRTKPIQVESSNGVNVQAPSVNIQVPNKKPLTPSNGVDVPMVEQD